MRTVKANQKLFDRWKRFGIAVDCCKSIVQNSVEISDKDFRDWLRTVYAAQQQLDDLIRDTVLHVTRRRMP